MAPGLGELSDRPGVRDRCIPEQRRRPRSKMEDGLDPQRDFEQRGPELDIPPPPQSKGIHLPSQTPHAPDHAPWMDVSLDQLLGTRMDELALVHDTHGLVSTLWRSTWISIRLASLLDLSTSSRDLST
ncbi:hypothetical protein AAG906_020451 [Vitis piasezkii]